MIGAKPPAPGEEASRGRRRRGRRSRPATEVARAADARHRQPGVGRVLRRPRARARAHAARRDLDRDVGGAELVLPVARALRPAGGARDRPVLRLPGGQGALRAVLGAASTGRCCATRARSFLEAGGRIEEADMVLRMLRVAIPAAEPGSDGTPATRPRRSRCCTRSAASRPTAARCARARRSSRSSRFLLYDSAYPGSVASSVEALRAALTTADAAAPLLAAGAAARAADRRPRAPAARAREPAALAQIARAGAGRARADRPRHRRPLLRDRRAGGGPSVATPSCTEMNFAIRYLTDVRLRRRRRRQPQRAAGQARRQRRASAATSSACG